jgi:hypothetical protein
METEQYLLSGIILFVISVGTALVPAKKIRTTASLIFLLGSLSCFFLGFYLIAAATITFYVTSVTSVFEFALRGEALSGFFVIIISLFYGVMADKDGKPLRVKPRSPSYCNCPAVPFAVHGHIVPNFPVCNKSFNLSDSGTNM